MKEAKIFNWMALIWTILGSILVIQENTSDIWGYIYLGTLITAQILALKVIDKQENK